MAKESYTLCFYKYESQAELPAESGIYCIYAYADDEPTKECEINELIYIGEAKDVSARFSQVHDEFEDCKESFPPECQFHFSFTRVVRNSDGQLAGDTDRKRAEKAMIYHHQPACNKQHKESFNDDDTEIRETGKNKHPDSDFTVIRSESK